MPVLPRAPPQAAEVKCQQAADGPARPGPGGAERRRGPEPALRAAIRGVDAGWWVDLMAVAAAAAAAAAADEPDGVAARGVRLRGLHTVRAGVR